MKKADILGNAKEDNIPVELEEEDNAPEELAKDDIDNAPVELDEVNQDQAEMVQNPPEQVRVKVEADEIQTMKEQLAAEKERTKFV